MKKIFILIVLVALLALLLAFQSKKGQLPPLEGNPNEVIACTMDAMMCPDGSYVGRSGPKCEFVCPNPGVVVEKTETVSLNQVHQYYEFKIQPTAVVSDSRCPSDVQCIQAGTVKVSFEVVSETGSQTVELEPGQTKYVGDLSLTLKDVKPYPVSTKKISNEEYSFIITLMKGTKKASGVTTSL